jgi:serine/threonine-protein kinase
MARARDPGGGAEVIMVAHPELAAREAPPITECLDGDNLADVLAAAAHRGRRVPVAIAIRIAADIAAALHHVHRDLCPANVVITRTGQIRLFDFGVARRSSVPAHAHYASPEQCRHDDVDERSDVFSLGIILYELVTLVAPFGSEDRIMDGAYLVPELIVPECPPALSMIIARCLQPVRELRYPTPADVLRDLLALSSPVDLGAFVDVLFAKRHARGSSPPPMAPAPEPPRHRIAVIAAACGLTLAASALATYLLALC